MFNISCIVKAVSCSCFTFLQAAAISAVNLKFFFPVCLEKNSLNVALNENPQSSRGKSKVISFVHFVNWDDFGFYYRNFPEVFFECDSKSVWFLYRQYEAFYKRRQFLTVINNIEKILHRMWFQKSQVAFPSLPHTDFYTGHCISLVLYSDIIFTAIVFQCGIGLKLQNFGKC